MKSTVHIEARLLWKWGRTKSGNFIAICDAIGQTVQADSFSHLLETMTEALGSTFSELFSTGDLEKFLRAHGWSADKLPDRPHSRNIRFDVPFELKGMGKRELQLVG